jgi:lipopolysaccharide biosynthesis glycosyltransferase
MIARTDISELYDLDIQGYCMGAVINHGVDYALKYKNYHYLSNKPVLCYLEDESRYLNTGLLVFDIQKFREKISYQDLFRFAIYFTNRFVKHLGDQDVLSLLVKDDYYILPSEWNYCWAGWNFQPAKPETKIVHFTTSIKPWKNESIIANNPDALAYLNYAKNIPLFGNSFSKPQQGEQNGDTLKH